MAKTNLQLNIGSCQSNTCKYLDLTDKTGSQLDGNITGYGDGVGVDPNFDTSEIVHMVLEILPPGSTTSYSFDTTGPTARDAAFAAAFPSLTGETPFRVSMADFGGTDQDKMPDGIWAFTLTAYLSSGAPPEDFIESTYQRIFTTCNAHCCVDELFSQAAQETNCSSCKKEKYEIADQADLYLKAAEYAANCTKYNMALEELAKVQFICSQRNCRNC